MKKSLVCLAAVAVGFSVLAAQTVLKGADAIKKFPSRLQNSEIAHLTDASWCQLMDGVEFFYGEFDKLYDRTANDVYYYKIDYQRAKVRMEFVDGKGTTEGRRSPGGSGTMTTSAAAKSCNALFGINCTFPKWYAKMDGSFVYNGTKEGGLALNDNKTFEFFKKDWWTEHPNADGYRDAFSTEAMGLYHGQITIDPDGNAPYTFMGATQDGGTIYVCVVDGRTSRSQGLGYKSVHKFLVELGCYDGLCLDGGGSTTMVCKKTLMPSGMTDRQKVADGSTDYYKMNNTSDGSERKVCNQLMFVACEAPEPTPIDKPTAKTGLVYNGTEQVGVPEGAWYIVSGNTGTDVGSYQASVTPRWGYCWQGGSTDSVTINWSIAKASLTVSDAAGAAITYGETLAASAVTGAVTPNVAGTFAWTNPGVVPSVADSGVTAYAGTFVPDDTKNYQSATFTATVIVNRREIAVPTAKGGLTFNFSEQTGVEVAEGYTLVGNTATAVGEHVATATLTDKANTCWADGERSVADKSIVWSIAAATPVVTGVAEAGTDYNGSAVAFDISNLDIGSHAVDELNASFAVNGKTYGGTVTASGADGYHVTFAVDAAGDNAVVASNVYSGAFSMWLGQGEGRVDVATGLQSLLQGALVTNTNDWFHETAETCGQTGVWTRNGEAVEPKTEDGHLIVDAVVNSPLEFFPNNSMDEHTKGVVEARVLYDVPGEEDSAPPPLEVQCASRIVEDDDTGAVKFSVYAALPDDQGGWNVGWHDWNLPAANDYAFVKGEEYDIRFVCDYETGTHALTCMVKAAGAAEYVPLFAGYLTGVAEDKEAERISSLGVFGNCKIAHLDGTYTRDSIDASLAAVDGKKYATVADGVAAAAGQPVRLLHRATWKPTAADCGSGASFLGKDLLILDLSDLGGIVADWTQSGDVWTVLLRALAPEIFGADRIGVCSWSWHDSMTSILGRMRQGGFRGMQLALSPWIWDDGEATDAQRETFGDIEGDEVLELIKSEMAKSNVVIHATMIAFADEDYTSTTTISNTCGLFYGLAPSATVEQRANAESKWAHRSNQFERAAILTGALKVPYLTAHLGLCGLDDESAGFPRLYWACKVCKDNGCKLLIETGMYAAEELDGLLARMVAAHPDIRDFVGLNFDSANQLLYGTDNPTHAFPILRKWIDQVHIKDCVEDLSLRGGWATDVEWGLGDVAKKYDFINYLRVNGFKGPLLVEHESGEATADVRVEEILTAVRALLTAGNADDPACTTPDWINPALMEGDTPSAKAVAALKAQGFGEAAVEVVAEAGAEDAYETVSTWAQTWADGWQQRGESAKPTPADISRMSGVLTSAAVGADRPLTQEDVKITSVAPSADGDVSVRVSLGDDRVLNRGNEALLKAALGVSGAYGLGGIESFSADNVDVSAKSVGETEVELRTTPKAVDGHAPDSFFFRATAR